VPNLNWSGDGHRARYFQIRGVGELEQYQGAPNPSVGFLIDDIDFSGIGTVATLFDIQSIEVLRGSQGSRYGANALGGLIYMRSTAPAAERDGRIQLMMADDDAISVGVAFGGALNADETSLFRVSAQKHESNGYRDNSYLGRKDTNGRDETSLRARLLLRPSQVLDVDIAVMYSNIDNGYDAFSLDNSYAMLSDKPGKDAQESLGASVRLDWSAPGFMTLTSVTTLADSDIDFSFDADWGNASSWAPVTYDYVSLSERSRKTVSQELRLASNESGRWFSNTTDWLFGFYVQNLREELVTLNLGDYYDPFYDFADSLNDAFGSDYEATNVALFGLLDLALNDASRLGFGLRLEKRSTDYADTLGLATGPSETMWGGELSFSHDHSGSVTSFVSLSKGYKAGGFNLGLVPPGRRDFGAEQLWTVETGIKTSLLDNSLRLNAAIFYSRRDDQQVRTSLQLVPGDPASFVFFTDNAAQGETLGAEAELHWYPADEWELYANIGLLKATFEDFVAPQGDLTGRDQAHAPRYSFSGGIVYRHPNGLFARLDASAKDAFYFDVSHDQKSASYELLNARVGYDGEQWLVSIWARNLMDQDYAVRGFYFGNEPPDFPNTLYTRRGDPRQLGVTIERRF
jgi:outer membrane receptor protein involved in Fe transport